MLNTYVEPHSGTAKTQRELGKTVNYFRAPSSAWEAGMRGDLEGGIDLFCVGKLTDGKMPPSLGGGGYH